MNLGVTHNCGHFQWLLIFLIHVFKQTFLLNFIIFERREERGRGTDKTIICASYSSKEVHQKFASVPKKQILNTQMNPWFVSGFTDAEGSFIISVTKSSTNRLGWSIQPYFKTSLKKKDLPILEKYKSYFKDAGKIGITGKGRDIFSYVISSKAQIMAVVLPHFDKYPLITQKRADYELFKRIIYIMNNKKHLTEEKLQEIINNKASLNLGLSDKLKIAFPNTIPVSRPKVRGENKKPIIYDPQWLAGFASGEGSFQVKIQKSATHKLKEKVTVEFNISQHSRDKNLINYFKNYLDCGNINISKTRPSAVYFSITKLDDILYKIIPFFKKHPIVGVKALDFEDFCKVAEMMRDNKHLSQEGLVPPPWRGGGEGTSGAPEGTPLGED